MASLSFIGRATVRLLTSYGQPVTLLKSRSQATDFVTGNQTAILTVKSIKAIPVTRTFLSTVGEDLSYVASNRQYTYGGLMDTGTLDFICLRREIGNFDLRLDDKVEYAGVRYSIRKITDSANNLSVILQGMQINEDVTRSVVLSVSTFLRLEGSENVALN